ncbi:MAG TPA: hypothetical protein VF919_16565 [Gemmatimonadales bacterium]
MSIPALWYYGLSFYVVDRYEQVFEQAGKMVDIRSRLRSDPRFVALMKKVGSDM